MHLIRQKLAGKELPTVVPASLFPRTRVRESRNCLATINFKAGFQATVAGGAPATAATSFWSSGRTRDDTLARRLGRRLAAFGYAPAAVLAYSVGLDI